MAYSVELWIETTKVEPPHHCSLSNISVLRGYILRSYFFLAFPHNPHFVFYLFEFICMDHCSHTLRNLQPFCLSVSTCQWVHMPVSACVACYVCVASGCVNVSECMFGHQTLSAADYSSAAPPPPAVLACCCCCCFCWRWLWWWWCVGCPHSLDPFGYSQHGQASTDCQHGQAARTRTAVRITDSRLTWISKRIMTS